jgi:bacterioferritin (cytochrome b1)
MNRPTPPMIGWLQRAVLHEFAATRQFTLQAVVARRLGDQAIADECDKSAAEELQHAQMFAGLLAESGAPFGAGASEVLPIGSTVLEILQHGQATEASAVRLYAEAARACSSVPRVGALFEEIGADEAQHFKHLAELIRNRKH